MWKRNLINREKDTRLKVAPEIAQPANGDVIHTCLHRGGGEGAECGDDRGQDAVSGWEMHRKVTEDPAPSAA